MLLENPRSCHLEAAPACPDGLWIILAVTSQVRPIAGVGEVVIVRWKESGLLKPSVLKPVLATIERGLVLRKIGRLEEEDRRDIRGVLGVILG